MRISVKEAEREFSRIAKLAQDGTDIIFTEEGQPSLQLFPIARSPLPPEERMAVFDRVRQRGRKKGPANFETDAAHSQDFLYDENGLPG